ncbi:TPR repeat region-containing protein [Streptomyces johnsoniae]|uniref:TPR repeat domain-containing protein n=1 Tax=Streptomyces johnsoniae TaxID=3075532 RepID=A0ABU2SBM6_9ACTN|nr:hypothetical protein [Streptomyces sp. DSM 41886]MDT0446378.1 hypothetical protein [Streptomyces sp. DSM 41886]
MVDAGYFRFTHEEAVRDGKNPWKLRTDFDAEIDLDDMVATGNAFVRAAGEAQVAEDLAARASQLSEQPGGMGGQSIVDGEGRLIETNNALPRTEAETAVDFIFRAMNAAHHAEEEARRLIERPELDFRHERNQDNAISEWNEWLIALGQAYDEQYAGLSPELRPSSLIVHHDSGETEYAQMSGNTFALPDSRAASIRAEHLKVATEDAGSTFDTINGEIIAYRRELAHIGNELGGQGYDLAGDPLGVFATPQMAQFSAEQLNAELARDTPPDRHVIEMHTRNLAAIGRDIHGDPPDPSQGQRGRMSPGDRAYLEAFHNTLTADSLAQLGRPDVPAGVQTSVGNSITMLMNPAIGGMDPETMGAEQVPASIRSFVYDYENSLAHRLGPLSSQEFNGFGTLMSRATVAAGDEFSKALAHAAVDIEKINEEPRRAGVPPENTASSGMLEAAALNTDASAELLVDPGFRGGLLSQGWDSSTGAAELVRSGTMIPPGVPEGSPSGRMHLDAAYHVLADAPMHKEAILGTGMSADNVELQRAIGDTAFAHMDLLSRKAHESDTWEPFDVSQPVNGTMRDYGFDLSLEERTELFGLMQKSDQGVRQDFFNGVHLWEAATARDALAGEGILDGGTLDNLGGIAGTVANVQSSVETPSGTAPSLAKATEIAGQGVALIPDLRANLGGTGLAAAANLLGDHLKGTGEQDLQNQQQMSDWRSETWGGLPGKLALVEASVANGRADPGDYRTYLDYGDETSINQYLARMTTANPNVVGYLHTFDEGYDAAVKVPQ